MEAEALGRISLYNNLFYVSLAVTGIALVLGVFFFFFFDIPSVFAIKTGRAKKKNVSRIKAKQAEGIKPSIATSLPLASQSMTDDSLSQDFTETVTDTTVLDRFNGATVPLSGKSPILTEDTVQTDCNFNSNLRFEITENIVLIHTDEII